MARIHGPTDMLGPFNPDGTPNVFANDLAITLFADKPRYFSADGTRVMISNIIDFNRLTFAKAAYIYTHTGGAAWVDQMPGMIGIAKASWDTDSPVVDHEGKPRRWSDLVDGRNYTANELDGVYWISEAALNPEGLDSQTIVAILTAGHQLKTHAEYQALLPAPELP